MATPIKIGSIHSPPGLFNVKSYGAVGDGSANDTTAIQNTITAAAGSTVYIPAGTYKIASAVTIPSTVALEMQTGAMFKKSASATLAINGPLSAPSSKIFDSFASGDVAISSNIEIMTEWFGAIADGATDCGAPLNLALGSLPGTGGIIKFNGGTYKAWTYNIAITKPSVTIRGCGRNATTLSFDAASSSSVGLSSQEDGLTIEDIKLSNGLGICVSFDTDWGTSSLNHVFSNVELRGGGGTGRGIYVNNNGGVTLINTQVKLFDVGIDLDGTTGSGGVGLISLYASNITDNAVNIKALGSVWQLTCSSTIIGSATTRDVILKSYENKSPYSIAFNDCHFEGNLDYAVLIQKADAPYSGYYYRPFDITFNNCTGGSYTRAIVRAEAGIGIKWSGYDSVKTAIETPDLDYLSGLSVQQLSMPGRTATPYPEINRYSGQMEVGTDFSVNSLQIPCPAECTLASGTLVAGSYSYTIVAINARGSTLPSRKFITYTLADTGGINVNWYKVTGATGYRIYGRIAGSEALLDTVVGESTLTWHDDGSLTPSGALPTNNTTGLTHIDSTGIINTKSLVLTSGGGGNITFQDGTTQSTAATSPDLSNYVAKTGSQSMAGPLTITDATGNSLVVDTSTLIVDALNHRVGIGTTAPAAGYLAEIKKDQAAATSLLIDNANATAGATARIDFGYDSSTKFGSVYYNCNTNMTYLSAASGSAAGLDINTQAANTSISITANGTGRVVIPQNSTSWIPLCAGENITETDYKAVYVAGTGQQLYWFTGYSGGTYPYGRICVANTKTSGWAAADIIGQIDFWSKNVYAGASTNGQGGMKCNIQARLDGADDATYGMGGLLAFRTRFPTSTTYYDRLRIASDGYIEMPPDGTAAQRTLMLNIGTPVVYAPSGGPYVADAAGQSVMSINGANALGTYVAGNSANAADTTIIGSYAFGCANRNISGASNSGIKAEIIGVVDGSGTVKGGRIKLRTRVDSNGAMTDAMTITAAQFVGIGTTAPAKKLHTYVSANSQNAIAIDTTGTGGAQETVLHLHTLGDGTKSLGTASTTKGWQLTGKGNNVTDATQRNNFVLFYYSGAAWSSWMNIKPTGEVGIGSSYAQTKVHMYDSTNVANILSIDTTGTGNAQESKINLHSLGDGAKALGVASSQGWTLSVKGNAFATAALRNSYITEYWNGSSWIPMSCCTSAGNMGILTTGPDFPLDVNGDVRIEEAHKLYFGGNGAADNDTNLYRSNTNELKTDDSFVCAATLYTDAQKTNTAVSMNIAGTVADGATAVAVKLRSDNAFSTDGAKLLSVQNNTTEKLAVTWQGKLIFEYTDSTGSPGNATIDKPSGKSAVASGASTCVVTNSTCKSTSNVIITPLSSLSACGITEYYVTPADGSFTVTVDAASADWSFCWLVIN